MLTLIEKDQADGSFATLSSVVLVGLSLELQSTTASTAGELSPTMSRVEHLCIQERWRGGQENRAECNGGIDRQVTDDGSNSSYREVKTCRQKSFFFLASVSSNVTVSGH